MKVFKRDGSDQWCGKIRLSPGKWRTVYLYTDKQASTEELWRLQKDADQRRAGLLTTATDAAALPLAEHVADFLNDYRRQGYADIPTGAETQNLRATGTVPLPQAEAGRRGEFTPPCGASDDLSSAHQMAHQNTRILVHGRAQEYTSASDEVKTTAAQKTPVNTAQCADTHDGALKAGDGTRTHDVQLGKLAFYH